ASFASPSSHSSSDWTKPSPQNGKVQRLVHSPWLSFSPPRSHSSPLCRNPSPQDESMQASVQAPSLSLSRPSSHSSPPSRWPSPQIGGSPVVVVLVVVSQVVPSGSVVLEDGASVVADEGSIAVLEEVPSDSPAVAVP